jgi:hypothetical protein
LVYCLEAVDQPGGFRLDDVVVDPAQPVTAHERPDLLGGVVTLAARGRLRPGGQPSGWWPYRGAGTARQLGADSAPQLGADTSPKLGAEVELTAVPYYAWANREPGAMRVWIPTT